eukprot:2220003-Pleurochrysis_carterae.AAC.1
MHAQPANLRIHTTTPLYTQVHWNGFVRTATRTCGVVLKAVVLEWSRSSCNVDVDAKLDETLHSSKQRRIACCLPNIPTLLDDCGL